MRTTEQFLAAQIHAYFIADPLRSSSCRYCCSYNDRGFFTKVTISIVILYPPIEMALIVLKSVMSRRLNSYFVTISSGSSAVLEFCMLLFSAPGT